MVCRDKKKIGHEIWYTHMGYYITLWDTSFYVGLRLSRLHKELMSTQSHADESSDLLQEATDTVAHFPELPFVFSIIKFAERYITFTIYKKYSLASYPGLLVFSKCMCRSTFYTDCQAVLTTTEMVASQNRRSFPNLCSLQNMVWR